MWVGGRTWGNRSNGDVGDAFGKDRVGIWGLEEVAAGPKETEVGFGNANWGLGEVG